MAAGNSGEPSAVIKERVENARAVQKKRFTKRKNFYCNGQMTPRDIKKFCPLDQDCEKLIADAVERLGFSARSYHRILKIGRTIADLDRNERLQTKHIAEAIQYRRLEHGNRF
jgi:magnesium chelatase family protein